MFVVFAALLALAPVPQSFPAAGAAPPLSVGRTFHYHPGMFARVAHNRGMALDWSADGFASVPNCRYVNVRRPWYVHAAIYARGAWHTLRLQIVDCSNPAHLAAQRARQLVLEVDWHTAHVWGFATYNGDDGPGHAPAQILGYTQ